ncbi:Methionine aminopeptidase (EC [uncultured Gammaproteobacteria bacterium]|nr:Methionine aminopeptidase (EC [uncultured Gammaproteobacteria bacterium]
MLNQVLALMNWTKFVMTILSMYKTPSLPRLTITAFQNQFCTSINNVVCHGIPGEKKLKKGDIINVDITVIKDDYHGDTSKMFIVGKSSVKAQRICRIAQECLYIGIQKVKPGIHLGEMVKLSALMQLKIIALSCVIIVGTVSARHFHAAHK